MNKMRSFSQKHIYLFSVIIIVLSFTPMILIAGGKTGWYSLLNNILVRVLPSIGLLLIMRALKITECGLTQKGLLKGIGYGWITLLFVACSLFEGIMQLINEERFAWPNPIELFNFFFQQFSIGLLEEILIRGLVLNLMLKVWGATKRGIYKAVIMSGLMFGCMHIINFIFGAQLITTLTQIVYAAFIGVYFAVLYLKAQNLWSVIILHALIDVGGSFSSTFTKQVSENNTGLVSDIGLTDAFLNILITLPFVIWAIYQMRKLSPRIEDRSEKNTA